MATFNEAKGHKPSLIRKALELAIFAKPWASGDTAITKIWSGNTSQLVIPTGYLPIGMVTKNDGATWTRDQETSDVESYGYAEPVRRDITRDVSGLSFTMQESKKTVMEMFHGIDLSAVTTDTIANGGSFYFDKPSRPVQRKYRILALGKDGDGPDAIYIARWLPNAQVTEMSEQSWTEGDEIKYPASLTAYTDEAFGTSFREIWGGPGLKHADMGFPAPA